jgi:hypothetical protein
MENREQFWKKMETYQFEELDMEKDLKPPAWWNTRKGVMEWLMDGISFPGATKQQANPGDFFEQTRTIYDYIIHYCDKAQVDEVDLYKNAAIPRSTFSKIRSMPGNNYTPSKYPTIICLALAMKLGKEDIQVFMNIAGYHLSNSIKTDRVVMYCVEHGIYQVERVDDYLEDYIGKRMLISA